MLERTREPKQKDVMLINDIPVKIEIEQEEKFASISNMNLITSLRTGKVNNYDRTPSTHKGIISSSMFCSYLSYASYTDGNFDFKHDFKKRKDLTVVEDGLVDGEGIPFYKLENQKDVFVGESLWLEFQALLEEIRVVQPKLIIVTGKWTLFFLTGCTSLVTNQGNAKDKKPLGGLNKFRSSILQISECWGITTPSILVPIFHTIHAMSMPDKVSIMELDIRKLGWMYGKIKEEGVDYYAKPTTDFLIGIDKEALVRYLKEMLARLDKQPRFISVDIETKFSSIVDCLGLSDEIGKGVCIPFAGEKNPNLWELDEEIELTIAMVQVLTHPNTRLIAQNGSYDLQFLYKLYRLDLVLAEDTMVASHILYNYLPKRLDFLASLYVDKYFMWKDMQNHG